MEYLKTTKKDIYRLGILDENGVPKKDENGKESFIEFDLADIQLPIKYNDCVEKIKLAQKKLRNKLIIIDKKQDHKGKKLLSSNQEAKIKALSEYYDDMEEAIDLFIGPGGTKKIFGERRYWEMYEDFSEMIKPFLPNIKLNIDSMADRIKKKYSYKQDNTLTDE